MSILNDKEQLVLTAVEQQALVPLPEIARRIKMPVHVVRYQVAKLIEKGVFSERVPFINPFRLGFMQHIVYLSLQSHRQSLRERFVADLNKSPHVSYFAEVGGDYQYNISLVTKDLVTVVRFFEDLGERFPGAIFEKAVATLTGFTTYGKKYLARQVHAPAISYSLKDEGVEKIDEVDDEILQKLATGKWSSFRDLARSVKLPVSTVERRLKNLEESGVICGYIYRVASSMMGMQVYRLLLDCRGVNAGFSAELEQFCRQNSEVVQMISCLGTWDYELRVEVSQPEQIIAVSRSLYDRFADQINSIKMLTLLKSHKFMNYTARA